MAKTVKDIVDSVLRSLESDGVNDIGDTIEASDVAQIVNEVYEDIIDEHDLPATYKTFQLEGLADTANPTKMKIPENIQAFEWIKYDVQLSTDTKTRFVEIPYCDPRDFLELSHQLDSSDANTLEITLDDNVTAYVSTNAAPCRYTTFDDQFVYFNSYDSSVESTMHSAKSAAYAQLREELVLASDTQIKLPTNLMRLLRAETRSPCWEYFKGGTTAKVEQESSRARSRAQRSKHRRRANQERDDRPDYGRRRPKTIRF